jgi:hypothetical protein
MAGLVPIRSSLRCLESPDFRAQLAESQRALYRQPERFHFEGLGDEIVGPCANRSDGGFEATERGHHYHRHVGVPVGDLLTQLQSTHAPHVQVGQDYVDILGVEHPERLFATRGRAHLESFGREAELDEAAGGWVVVDDEDVSWHRGSGEARSIE